MSVTSSSIFPFPFRATRWVENKKVADRVILVWSHIVEIVRFWQKLVPSKQPKCKSYTTLREAGNNLITNILKLFVKLEVIKSCKTASDLLEIDL